MYLPSAEADEGVPAGAAAGVATVLVLEAERGVRDLIAEILEIHGYHVLAAGDVDEARAVCGRHPGPLALVIADLLSPGVGGPGWLCHLGPARTGVKVLYLSGDVASAVEESGRLPEAGGVLPKPFTVDALVHKVQAMLA
jgi:DNA-binding response OmpR family regulator